MLTPEIKNEFMKLSCFLSPENVCRDGEASRSEADCRRRDLMRKWKALEIKAGQTVTESDAWSWDVEIDWEVKC